MVRRWATLGELAQVPRRHALDTLELLDALEEAEDKNRPKPRGRGGE